VGLYFGRRHLIGQKALIEKFITMAHDLIPGNKRDGQRQIRRADSIFIFKEKCVFDLGEPQC
jgi:hypothetical protein